MRRSSHLTVVAVCAGLLVASLAGPVAAVPDSGHGSAGPACHAGTRTLSSPGSVMYPDTGNGGYTSVHTGVYLDYSVPAQRFLTGTHVVLTDRATWCLTSFSLDFERHSLGNLPGGPDLAVQSVEVDGHPARFHFAQPTYPGDPKGVNDPDPRAHEVSQTDPVGGPDKNPLPPACSPELRSASKLQRFAQDGAQCPANKLVITPSRSIPGGATFTVRVNYTGRPGVHHDGDGSSEGWFMTAGGSSMTTEPIGTEDWMPLNDYPTAKPTYDFYETTNQGKTVICNGKLLSVTKHQSNAEFPSGSATWHWHAAEQIASYLVLSIIGDYTLTFHVAPNGMRYYEAQDTHISAQQRARNRHIMNEQQNITHFESIFNGPFPFASDGVVAGIPGSGGDTEEMETMIVFTRGIVSQRTLYHENMHQWWGDHVTEDGYRMTFYKEGLATFGEFLMLAREAAAAHGDGAFDRTLIQQFDHVYASGGPFWGRAPSNPAPYTLFDDDPTYERPGAAYVALWQILGKAPFIAALHAIQQRFGGAAIDERQLEAEFTRFLPVHTPACTSRLQQFFAQWFDTSYPTHGVLRPSLTGPGLDGPGFYGGCCHR